MLNTCRSPIVWPSIRSFLLENHPFAPPLPLVKTKPFTSEWYIKNLPAQDSLPMISRSHNSLIVIPGSSAINNWPGCLPALCWWVVLDILELFSKERVENMKELIIDKGYDGLEYDGFKHVHDGAI